MCILWHNSCTTTLSIISSGSNINKQLKFKFVIYRVKSIQLFALLFYDEGDWPTKFQIGTPRPEKNVLASLHYSAFDSASWDIAPV